MGGHTLVLVRDDDTCYFTPVEWIERVHAPLLARGLPLNLSVIPSVACDARLPDMENLYFRIAGMQEEPYIPPSYRSRTDVYPVPGNDALCRFLRNTSNVEVLQHGFTHRSLNGKREFAAHPEAPFDQWLTEGITVIEQAWGRRPAFFVPPGDVICTPAVEAVRRHFTGISLSEPRRRLLPWWRQAGVRRERAVGASWLLSGRFLLVGHAGMVVSRFHSPAYVESKIAQLLQRNTLIVLVTHYWEFFFDWDKPDVRLLAAWHRSLETMLQNPNVRFISFDQLYARLMRRNAGGQAC